jgi:nucleotide-binding universal stress UspA family protein
MAALAREFETPLVLVHVVDASSGPPWSKSHLRAHDRERLVAARSRLKKMAESIEDTTVECRVLIGSPSVDVPALAQENNAALIVLTLRPGRGLFGPRQGSITYRILCGSTAPVLALLRERRRR